MGHTCCAPNCKSNYKPGENISTFGFPKSETKKQEWLSAIKREKTYKVTEYSRVYIKHFHESDIERETVYTDPRTGITYRAPLKNPRLVKDAVPKILPNCPQYLTKTDSKRESAEERRIRIENEQLAQVIAESEKSHEEYNQKISFSYFQEFFQCFENRKNLIDNIAEWDIVYKPNAVLFLLLENSVPKIRYAVTLNDECNVRVYNEDVELNFEIFFINSGVAKLSKITNLNELGVILNHVFNVSSSKEKTSEVAVCVNAIDKLFNKLCELVDDDQVKYVEFLQEQIRFLITSPSQYRYSTDLMILSAIFHSISPHSYKFVRDARVIVFPHPRTLNKLCASVDVNPMKEQFDTNFLSYVGKRITKLEEKEKLVILMMDEIHLKPFLDFKGGNVVGSAYNTVAAVKTAFVFMLRSLRSKFKEVAHILPVCTIKAEDLFAFLMKLLRGLHNIGFKVLAIVSDNNAINSKAISMFCSPPQLKTMYRHPFENDIPLFFLFDTVHIMKCIWNNWINKKDSEQTIDFPEFYEIGAISNFLTASFASIKKLYHIEEHQLVKYAPSLNMKSFFPSNFERQNVKFVLNVFKDTVKAGLIGLGEEKKIPHYKGLPNFSRSSSIGG